MWMTCEPSLLLAFPPNRSKMLSVCFSFNVIGRLADAFGFFVPGPESFEGGAKYLLGAATAEHAHRPTVVALRRKLTAASLSET